MNNHSHSSQPAPRFSSLIGVHCFRETLNYPFARAVDTAAKAAWDMPSIIQLGERRSFYVPGGINESGDLVCDLDQEASDHFTSTLLAANYGVLTEENFALLLPTREEPTYVMTVDPLDGSSLKQSGVPTVGVIIGVFLKPKNHWSGKNLLASIVMVIGAQREMHVAIRGKGTYVFTESDFAKGDAGTKVHLDAKAKYIHQGATLKDYSVPMLEHVVSLGLSNAYFRCLAADVNFMLSLSGGSMFIYPKPRLRLLYELLPIALMIGESRGGAYLLNHSNNLALTLDEVVVPLRDPHASASVIFGSQDSVLETITASGFIIQEHSND